VPEDVGVVGSPSTTIKITVDILEDASGSPLQGQLVYLTHPLDEKVLIALGTVTEIGTSNRWHEDPNMRGVLKRYGSLPHLSGVGDVRSAEVLVQAAYLAESENPADGQPPVESGGALSMSPTTGASVARVTDGFLRDLLRRHETEIVYLGLIYRSNVRMPLVLRDFAKSEEGGAGEAYHTGVFGMTGSGKSGLAAYLLAAQLRHPNLGVFIMDPQGQFTSEVDLPFSLHEWAERLGRNVRTYSVSSDLRLAQDAYLMSELLGLTRFFRDTLTVRHPENRESLVAEFVRVLQGITGWPDQPADDVLRSALGNLVADANALQRIYATDTPRNRLIGAIQSVLSDATQFEIAAADFRPLHSLFTATNLAGGTRSSIHNVLEQALAFPQPGQLRPLIIIDLSAAEDTTYELLRETRVKARILRMVCSMLNRRAEEQYRNRGSLNVLVVFDEAQRFAAQEPEDDQSGELANKLVDYVRTTRKYGLGWMFITQEIGSLRRGIYNQLRVRAFGYGLTSGVELSRLRDTIGDPSALELYRSFVDPGAVPEAEYPFMLTGPVSPLSFTGAPVFLSVYTDFNRFLNDNGFSDGGDG
jgi:hypothetical protein